MQTKFFNIISKNLLFFIIFYVILIDEQKLLKKQQTLSSPSRRIGGGFLFGASALEATVFETHNGALSSAAVTTGTTGTLANRTTTATVNAAPPIRMPPPPVKLNKCCHFNEHLDATQNCIAENIANWVPHIFLINRKTYYEPKGSSPRFITFEENTLPFFKQNASSSSSSSSENVVVAKSSGCSAIDKLEYFSGSRNLILFSNGSLYLKERAQLVHPNQFCVDYESALVCLPNDNRSAEQRPLLKLKKCCSKNLRYDPKTKSCSLSKSNKNNDNNNNNNNNDHKLKLPLHEDSYQTIFGFPDCHESSTSYAFIDWHESQLHNETGHLKLQHKNLSAIEYCFEYLHNDEVDNVEEADEEVLKTNSSISRKNDVLKIFACLYHFTSSEPANAMATTADQLMVTILNIAIVISVVFLAATLVAGYMMPSVHHVLHWRCQIYYVLCLFIGEFLLAYTQLSSSLELGSPSCILMASAMHFFFLSAFFWLNTMCFNIWWTFRDFRPSSLERNQELLRLRLYSAYAWGIPLLITVISVAIDQLPDTQLVRPGFGVRACWFSGEHLSIFAYFYGPIGILLCANIVLFISTTHQLTCGLWKRDDVKSTSEKTALGKVCLKLVVVMGVTWIVDIISWIVGGPYSAWFFTDLINALQGVFIFIVVGCQPQVWAACKRYCCPRSRQEITNTTNGVQHSSSSQGLPSMAACGAEITQNTSVNNTSAAGIGVGVTVGSGVGGGGGGSGTQQQEQQQLQVKIPMETVC